MRKTTSLNFGWLYTRKEAGKALCDHDETTMEMVDIPHNNIKLPFNNLNEKSFQFTSIYKKHLDLNPSDNKRYFINFEGVAHRSTIYLNHKFVFTHDCGYTPFTVEITNYALQGQNVLEVLVESDSSLNQPPFGKTVDYLTYGGIYREVSLIETAKTYIQDVNIKTRSLLKNPEVEIKVTSDGQKRIDVEIFDEDKMIFKNSYHPQENIKISYPFVLWDLENPKLYGIKIILDDEDTYEIKTGFREIEFRKNGFYLNGKKVKIIGLNRHQMYPYAGYAMPKNVQRKDAEILKTLGNAVRTSHYPQSRHFLDACDELGLLVFIEAPGWQHIGDDTWKEHYKQSVKDMIISNKHHPSIVIWGVRVNESGDDSSLYNQTNELARSLDDRPTGGVRCFSFSEELEDVYTYNDFFHNGTNDYLKNIDEVVSSDIPYLITEFNGHMFPTKTIDNSKRLLEHALRYAGIFNEIEGNDRIAGGFGWQFVDYYTNKEFGSGDGICYHGVCDVFRMPKPAAKVLESQLAEEPYLEVLHGSDIGDFDCGFINAFHVASNCEHIDLYQDDRHVSRFFPRKDLYPNLKAPLYIIDDLFGDDLLNEGYSKDEAKEIAKIALEIAKRGGIDKITKADSFHGAKAKEAWDLYGKYIANWGSDAFTYRFVGSHKGKTITKIIGPYESYEYEILADETELTIADTYDATRIAIKAIDNNGNIRKYCFDSFKISAEGAIEIIGEEYISLIGGQRSIWVKTKKPGPGLLKFENNHYKKTIGFDVKIIKKSS